MSDEQKVGSSLATSERSAWQMRSLVQPSGELQVYLERVPVAPPQPNEVQIRITAAPINPSDLGVLFAGADMTKAAQVGSAEAPRVRAQVSAAALKTMTARLGVSMPVGNEGAGEVVAAGSSAAAQALLGRSVAALGGAMYSQLRNVALEQCLPLPPGATAAQGASAFVNPLTALCMLETMRREGHSALIHTAAASNLGQMLNRICLKDKINLVNIVRSAQQRRLLESQGAQHVCDSSSPDFVEALTEACSVTGATLAFDAIAGGKLAGQILMCMEYALTRNNKVYSPYGSQVHKQVYLYGSLSREPTEFQRGFGMGWGIGGWLVTWYLEKIGAPATQALKARVAAELTSTFASQYAGELSLREVLDLQHIAIYAQAATGQKYLVNPNRGG